jgi:energy-converting hydrogenase B subunit D
MTHLAISFDLLLVLTFLGVAWRVVTVPDLFQGVVSFILFGLLLALAWMRLAAPDVALAEAAIGAGLIGVLLLEALRHVRASARRGRPLHEGQTARAEGN